jgi:hypothetical protein
MRIGALYLSTFLIPRRPPLRNSKCSPQILRLAQAARSVINRGQLAWAAPRVSGMACDLALRFAGASSMPLTLAMVQRQAQRPP